MLGSVQFTNYSASMYIYKVLVRDPKTQTGWVFQ